MVKKLITVKHDAKMVALCEKIKNGEMVNLTINCLVYGKQELMWDGYCVFTFEVCKCGNPNYNATTVIRDMINHYNYLKEEEKFTYKMVASLISWEAKKTIIDPQEIGSKNKIVI